MSADLIRLALQPPRVIRRGIRIPPPQPPQATDPRDVAKEGR